MGKVMNKLPTVISCCFCCFLRAGSVLIAIVSFLAGLALAPNVTHTRGYWDFNGVIRSDMPLEVSAQLILGLVSIMLCVFSVFLIIGALCNLPKLIEFYQWGAVFYCGVTVLIYLTLITYCFVIHGNCFLAGGTLFFLAMTNVILTAYFIIVVNSLRMSMVYLGGGLMDIV